MKKLFLLLTLSSFFLVNTASAGIIYVNADVVGSSNTGSSWADAFDNLQSALDQATGGDTIWVAKGNYFPSVIAGTSIDDRDKTFLLKDSVSIFGGFTGTESALNQRTLNSANATVLSGKAGSSDTNNLYHVVLAIGISGETTLDGFTIRYGNANGTGTASIYSETIDRNLGGGVYILNSDLVMRNMVVDSNQSSRGGAGINNENSDIHLSNSLVQNNEIIGHDIDDVGGGAGMRNSASNPIISKVTFENNVGTDVQGGGAMRNINGSSADLSEVHFLSNHLFTGNEGDGGGAMYNLDQSNPIMQNVTFKYNSTDGGGGAIYNDNSIPEVTFGSFISNTADVGGAVENDASSDMIFHSVLFKENEAQDEGGAIFNWKSNPVITNSVFEGNSSVGDGGALNNYNNSSPTLTNVLFKGNSTDGNGGAIYNRRNANPIITNCLIVNNTAGDSGGGIYIVASNNESSSPILTNVTIADNTALVTGGGGYDDGNGNTQLRNSIISENTAPLLEDINAPIAMLATALNSVIIGDEFYLGGLTQPVTITGDLFVASGLLGEDYRLAQGSYAIDQGDGSVFGSSATPDLSAITTDISGADRIAGSSIDLGAFEACTDTLVPSVSITYNPVSINAYDLVTYTATPVNGGDYPQFVWFKNNSIVQSGNSAVFSGVAHVDLLLEDTISVKVFSSLSCANFDSVMSNEIIVDYEGVGISQTKNGQPSFQIYPNPNSGNFYIKGTLFTGKQYHLELTDLLGRRHYFESFVAQRNDFKKELNFNKRLQPGIYFLNIQGSGEAKQVSRIVIQ